MGSGEPGHWLTYIIPYRLAAGRIELCLIKPTGAKYWEFPSSNLPGDSRDAQLLRAVRSLAGLVGEIDDGGPLDRFNLSLDGMSHSITAVLMHVSSEGRLLQATAQHRRWCQSEEVRAWIRRKPIRRLIDLALRRARARQSGEGESGKVK